jgi:hypothetical protein
MKNHARTFGRECYRVHSNNGREVWVCEPITKVLKLVAGGHFVMSDESGIDEGSCDVVKVSGGYLTQRIVRRRVVKELLPNHKALTQWLRVMWPRRTK